MENEPKKENGALTPVVQPEVAALDIKNPVAEVAYAAACAEALMGAINKKQKKVMINGEQYLEFEDWQTLARFYKCSVRVEWTKALVSENKFVGYEARASVIDFSGRELSAAEAACSITEAKWKNRERFQLRSMAQTRACAKALRNVFSWVVVMAGLKPTPAEELTEYDPVNGRGEIVNEAPEYSAPAPTNSSAPSSPHTQSAPQASAAQKKLIKSLMAQKNVLEVDALVNVPEASSVDDLNVPQASAVINFLMGVSTAKN